MKPYGFDYLWLDETEPDIDPAGDMFMVGPGIRFYNVYPLFHTASVYEGFRRDFGDSRRVMILARAAYLGAQRNGTVFWSSDIVSTWDMLKRSVPAGLKWRQQVCSMLQTQPQLCIVAEAADGLEAVQKAEELQPDLILLDIGLPNLNGFEAAKRIREVAPGTKIIFVTQNSDKDTVRGALTIGAQGYILKTDAPSELIPAVAGVVGGDDFVSSGIKWGDLGDTENR